jgi:hypothetical protein
VTCDKFINVVGLTYFSVPMPSSLEDLSSFCLLFFPVGAVELAARSFFSFGRCRLLVCICGLAIESAWQRHHCPDTLAPIELPKMETC